jgi:hypothetical protein
VTQENYTLLDREPDQDKVFLSIDVDFWRMVVPARHCLTKLFEACGDIPVSAVTSHEQMLGHVNVSDANHLINVDEHDDNYWGNLRPGINDGNWVSHVCWRKYSTLTWVSSYPDVQNFNTHEHKKSWDYRSQWARNVLMYSDQYIDLIPYLKNCVGIGLCLSPGYAPLLVQETLQKLTEEHGIPILGEDPFKGANARCPSRPKLVGV